LHRLLKIVTQAVTPDHLARLGTGINLRNLPRAAPSRGVSAVEAADCSRGRPVLLSHKSANWIFGSSSQRFALRVSPRELFVERVALTLEPTARPVAQVGN
jgi:hypothetical protein